MTFRPVEKMSQKKWLIRSNLITNNQGISMLSNVTSLAQNLKVVPTEQKELASVNNATIVER